MSRIKENLIGYEHEPNDWIEPTALEMCEELVAHDLYCMTLSEVKFRVAKQVREEYYSQDINIMRQQYVAAFGNQTNKDKGVY
jgi:hypothetical protein